MSKSTQSLPLSPAGGGAAERDSSPPKSAKSVSFAPRAASALSEPCLSGRARPGVKLKFRQYNLSSTPETTV